MKVVGQQPETVTETAITEHEMAWLEIYSKLTDEGKETVETALHELQRERIRFADSVAEVTGLTTREVLALGGF